MVGDDPAEVVRVTPIAPEGLHQHGNTGLVFDNQVQHHLVEVRALIPTTAASDVHDMRLRFLVTVRAAIDMETRTIKMGERGCQAQPRGRRGGNEALEFGHPKCVQRIQSSPKGVIIEMTVPNAWGNEARERLILEKMGHEGELLIEKAEAIEHHGFHRMAGGHKPHFRVLFGSSINDVSDAEFFKQACDQTQVI